MMFFLIFCSTCQGLGASLLRITWILQLSLIGLVCLHLIFHKFPLDLYKTYKMYVSLALGNVIIFFLIDFKLFPACWEQIWRFYLAQMNRLGDTMPSFILFSSVSCILNTFHSQSLPWDITPVWVGCKYLPYHDN